MPAPGLPSGLLASGTAPQCAELGGVRTWLDSDQNLVPHACGPRELSAQPGASATEQWDSFTTDAQTRIVGVFLGSRSLG